MDVNMAMVGTGAAVIGGVIIPLVMGWSGRIKSTQALLFSKHDSIFKDLQEYKLEVAKTYINREALRDALEPIKTALQEIKNDIHQARKENL